MNEAEINEYKSWLQNVPLDFQKKLVEDFTTFSIDYAKKHIAKKQNEFSDVPSEQLPTYILSLQKWFHYIEFQEHTLGELTGEKLDKAFASFSKT